MKRHHEGSDGWITLAQKQQGKFAQHHYRYQEMSEALAEWTGEDVYFSQNTFYKPRRLIENVRQLRSLYVDVDFYLLNYNPDWVIGKMELELFGQSIPEPNMVIHSGRGFVLVWRIEPVPAKALPLWQAVEDYLSSQFKNLGGDTKATDAARVFRIAGSVNSKSQENVSVQYRHNYLYTLRQIQEEYLPEIQPRKKDKPKGRGRPSKVTTIFNVKQLHYTRLMDITKLIEIRNYDVRSYREIICFLYRYWGCCYVADEDEALRHTLELNSSFREPLSDREVIKATKSAETAWKARSNAEANRLAREQGYPGAGYNVKNAKIIEWLKITPEEQKQLKTIIGREEKKSRNTLAKREKRGSVDRGTYLANAQERRETARKLKAEGLKYKQIAEAMNAPVNSVKEWLKKNG